MITETEPVQAALDELRAIAGPKVDLAEVVVIGAREQARRLREAGPAETGRRALRERFLERSLTGEGIDDAALIEIHERGWTRG